MKKSIISLFLILSIIAVQAGKLKGKVQSAGDNGMISFSLNGNGGTSMSTGVSNAFSFNPNVGIEVGWGNFGLGIDASTFKTLSNFDFDAYSTPLKNLDYLKISNLSNSWRSTSILFGPSYTIPLGLSNPIPGIGIVVKHNPPATLTLSVKGGVSINQTPDFSIVDNSTPQKTIATNNSDTYKKNVLTFKPSIVFAYWFSENLAVNFNAQYTTQLGQGEFITKYRDLSKVEFTIPKADLVKQQITGAPALTFSSKGVEEFMSFGAGLTFRFGKKGWDGSIKGNKKRINEGGLKKNEAEYALADAEVKAIAETLVNMRKGWDGSVKGGNIVEKKGIQENGIKENEAKSENTNLRIKTIAETLVNIARKGWDGSVKGNKVAYKPTDSDIELVTETLENIRKGWDGSVKGNKTEYVANEADVKAIAETMVSLRKGWDGSVKGGKKNSNVLKTKHDTVKNSINNVR